MKCQWISHIRLIKTLVTVTVWQHFCVQLKSLGLVVMVKRQLLRLGVTVVTRILLISPPHVAASLLTVPVWGGLSKMPFPIHNPHNIYMFMYYVVVREEPMVSRRCWQKLDMI